MASLGYVHDRENRLWRAVECNRSRVAVFAHGGFGGVFLSQLLDVPYPQFASRFSMSHSAVTVLSFPESGEGVATVLQFGNDGHLYGEHLPTRFCNRFYI